MPYDLTSKAGRLKYARLKSGAKTAQEIIRKTGVKQPTYSGHESGTRDFDENDAATYVQALNGICTVAWLMLGGRDGAPPGTYSDNKKEPDIWTSAPPGTFHTELGERLYFVRKARMLDKTPEVVAEALKCTVADLLAYEAGQKPMSAEELFAFSQQLDVSSEFLLLGKVGSLGERLRELWRETHEPDPQWQHFPSP